MATAEPIQVSLTKYLRTCYRPDRHFLDGYLEKRNLGDWTHGTAQVALAGWCGDQRPEWNVRAAMSLRLRISPTRIRVCDFCLLSGDAPRESIPSTPPVLCIETISPRDRFARTVSLCDDYLAMGLKISG